MTEIEQILGIKFKNKQLLREALTHKSYAIEKGLNYWNERMEFLGDSVLSSIIAEYLYLKYPDSDEGYLSQLRSQIVSRKTLADWSREYNLGKFLMLSRGEESTGGREKETMLSNVLEAVIGAIYLDSGYEKAKEFIQKYLTERDITLATDYKSKLQEIIQAKYKMLPQYKVLSEYGPEHKKIFKIGVNFRKKVISYGTGKSKKEAEQNAAKHALKYLTKIREV
ncbi:MAG: ribonuclease III [Elusimicrobiota bacterium]